MNLRQALTVAESVTSGDVHVLRRGKALIFVCMMQGGPITSGEALAKWHFTLDEVEEALRKIAGDVKRNFPGSIPPYPDANIWRPEVVTQQQTAPCHWCHVSYAAEELQPAATDIVISRKQGTVDFIPVWLCTACMARYDQEDTERITNAKPGSGQYPVAITFVDGAWHISYSGPR